MRMPIVYIFFTGERTLNLCIHSFKSLGFTDIRVVDGDDSFKSKYVRSAQDAVCSDHDFFIRTDADRIVFDGMIKLVEQCDISNPAWIEGQYFDYFMNRFRGGTPHILPRKAMSLLAENPGYMKNSKKPESDYSKFLKDSNLVNFNHTKILTNLHDYEQYPSKVCNTFLNRLKRGHNYLYDMDYIQNNIPKHYISALQHAINIFNSGNYDNMNSMDFVDFSHLDDKFPVLEGYYMTKAFENLSSLYKKINDSRNP